MAAVALNLVTIKYATTAYGTLLNTTTEADTQTVPIEYGDSPIGTTTTAADRKR